MTAAEWIGLGGLALTVLAGIAWAGALTYHFGKQSQRLDSATSDIEKIQTTQDEHAKSIAGWAPVAEMIKELRDDVRHLMMDGARSGRGGHGQ